MATELPPEPGFNKWGLPLPQHDPPPIDPELGFTTDDDVDGWEPRPVSRTDFAMVLAIVVFSWLRTLGCKTGIHRRRKYL